jgi:hypothetical protein
MIPFLLFESLALCQKTQIVKGLGATYRLEIIPEEDFKPSSNGLLKINTVYHY